MPNSNCLLHRNEVSKILREPYIINGYRRTNTSLWQCIKYMFVLHNDFGNFWTHFIALWIWLYWLYCLSFQLDFTDPFWYPLLSVMVGGCLYTLFSSIAHGFGSKSVLTYLICFMIDFQGISLYTLAGGIAAYFYERPIGNFLLNYKWFYIVLCVVMSINAVLICSLAGHFCVKRQYVLKAGSYVLPFMFESLPFSLRMYHCVTDGGQCVSETIPVHIAGFVASNLMAFFFLSKLPERIAPGKFDYFLHSHQLFHIMALVATFMHVYVLRTDATARRAQLMQDPYYRPDLYSALAPFLFVFAADGLIVIVMGVLLYKGYILKEKLN